MEKRTIQEIAAILVEKNGLDKRTAEQFAQTLFAVISEGLERDGLVKVRGLGTFKIVEVSDRESVSVSTGERVLIQGHSKVTFTPDATMKELVNKPFSQFETVALNEGVDFEDMNAELPQSTEPEPEPEQEVEAEPEPVPVEEVVAITIPEPESEPEVEAEPEPVYEEDVVSTTITEPEPVVNAELEPEVEAESKPEPEVEVETQRDIPVKEKVVVHTVYVPQEQEPNKPETWKSVLKVFGTLLLLAAAVAVGYYFGYREGKNYVQEVEVATPAVAPVDTTANDTVKIDTTASPKVTQQPVQEPVAVAKPEVKEEKPAVKEVEDKWEKADQRLKYGAYRIVGEDYTIKVRAGETTSRIAKRTLGPDMECYIEAFNSIKSNNDLKEGQTVKIPKLELKKKMKK